MDLKEISKIAKKYMDKNDIAHGWDHVQRVYNLCVKIGEKEGADMEVLKLAALLHDVGIYEDRKNHEIVSSRIAEKLLSDYEKREKVVYCIKNHRFSKGKKVDTLEAKILQDADRLDVLGAMGIVRTMVYTGCKNRPVHIPGKEISDVYTGESDTAINHFYEKLLKIKDSLNTNTAIRMAEERDKYMRDFLEEFFAEWDGER